ncbi:hypothetical protein AGMMS50268_37430 [Spirochaetia bacterium]|nr:hypothetical protein AGMMS49546_36000 [Spirochaetia bacterium]GHV93240.1 hypothetical protein AGMMS50268_37430 [Spirochaetia bacterium]
MKKSLFLVMLGVVLVLGLVFTACPTNADSGGGGSKLEGTWVNQESTKTFVFTGGNFTFTSGSDKVEGTFEVELDKTVKTIRFAVGGTKGDNIVIQWTETPPALGFNSGSLPLSSGTASIVGFYGKK